MDRIKKLLLLLSRREKKNLALLVAALVICSFIGVAGIASIMPFIQVLSKPEVIRTNEVLAWIYSFLGFTDPYRFMLILGVTLLCVFIFSNLFLTVTIWMELYFVRMIGYNMTRNLFVRYVRSPYSFFLLRNSSELTKNLFSEVQQILTNLVKPFMEIITKGILSLAIIIFLLVVNIKVALVLGVFLVGSYSLIFMVVKKKLTKIGFQKVSANARRFKMADEAFGSIKDIKLLGKEQIFIERFSWPAQLFERATAHGQILSRMPKYFMETIAFGGMLTLVLFLFATKNDISDILPLLALYAFAGYRLLPSLQDMFAAITLIRSNLASLDIIFNDLHGSDRAMLPIRTDFSVQPFRKELRLKGVSFRYESASKPVFRNFSFKVRANTTIGIVGPTGCGKTTLIDLILGLIFPDEGSMTVDGVGIDDSNRHRWQNNCGYVPQRIYLADDTIRRNIAFGVPEEKIDMEAVINAAKMANIHDFITAEMEKGYETIVGDRGIRISGGQTQRIGIARALYTNPDVLILDEATSALDGQTENVIMEAVNNLASRKTIIMIAHRLATLAKCDVIYVLQKGRIAESGSFEDLSLSSDYFREQGYGGSRKREKKG